MAWACIMRRGAARVVMKMNVEGKKGRAKKRYTFENDRGLLVCALGMWKIETSEGLGQGWPIPNS